MAFNQSSLSSEMDSTPEGGIRKRQQDPDLFTCDKCSGTYHAVLRFAQYPDSHTVAYGQAPAEKSPQYVLLVCGRCLSRGTVTLIEPRIYHATTRSREAQMYDDFVDVMNEPENK